MIIHRKPIRTEVSRRPQRLEYSIIITNMPESAVEQQPSHFDHLGEPGHKNTPRC